MSRLYFICFQVICICFAIHGQNQFIDKTLNYGIDHSYGTGTAGGGVSFVDFDGDGLDDLSFASSNAQSIHFYRNTGTGLLKMNLLPDLNEEVKHLLWVDFDNDGDKDLFLTLADTHNRIFVNEGNLYLSETSLGLANDAYTSFGACWGDYNRDGWLDLYLGVRRIEKDGLPNINNLYQNNGKSFFNVTATSQTEDGGKTPFCSSFIDYNNDKWPDIYTAHDRRRGNTMLKNNQDGTFSDVSKLTGTDLKMDGMSVSYGDCNNDGFFDIYVSNSEVGNALFVNQNGQNFSDKAIAKGVAFNSVAWGTNFLDGDNDGDQDLYVSGMLVGSAAINSRYYINQYPDSFYIAGTKIESDTVSSFNNAVGDINDDGYPDMAVINVGYPSFLFQNAGGNNNYIKVKLRGVLSNRDGIGSTITLFHNGKKQQRYTQCGVGFMGQNSYTEIFGLGQSEKIDSLTILWPTGHMDKLFAPDINKKHIIAEGSTTSGEIYLDNGVNILIIDDVSDEEIKQTKYSIFPNPAKDGIAIIHNVNDACIHTVSIFDLTGKIIYLLTQPDKMNLELPTSQIASGRYSVVIRDCDGKITSLPFIISK
jgi:ASPIC and UnbV/FG-GAP-like repeat/Secretion system C-terminal sorting domain